MAVKNKIEVLSKLAESKRLVSFQIVASQGKEIKQIPIMRVKEVRKVPSGSYDVVGIREGEVAERIYKIARIRTGSIDVIPEV